MFKKEHIDAVFGVLNSDYKNHKDSEQLHRDAHLAIAYIDANKNVPTNTDPIVVTLLNKYGPKD
jgi:hypothetical protein